MIILQNTLPASNDLRFKDFEDKVDIMVLKILESKCTDLPPPIPFFFWISTPVRFPLVTQKRFRSLVLASPVFLPLTLHELTAFKPNDVMCIRASNTFSYVKKWHVCWGALSVYTSGDFIYIYFFFFKKKKKQESGCKLLLTFFSICVKHMFQKNRREKLSLTGKL